MDEDMYYISKDFFLHQFLTVVPGTPLQDTCRNDTLSPQLECFATVLQKFMVLNYLVEGFASAVRLVQTRPTARSSLSALSQNRTYAMLKRLTEEVYVGSQQELCRARGSLPETKKSERVKVHPTYRLLVISPDPVSVRDSQEETGKRLFKLEKGTIVNAYERAIGEDNMLRYHIDDGSESGGWISFCRNSVTTEPQIEVIDTFKSDSATVAKQTAEFEKKRKLVSTQKKFDFHKVSNVSPRRAGFMTFFHFHSVMRHVLSSLAWMCAPSQPSGLGLSSDSKQTADYTYKILPLISNTLIRLLPPLPVNVSSSPNPVTRGVMKNEDIDSSFFVTLEAPDIASFSIAKTFRTIHVVELCHYFIFEDNKSFRGEPNILLLVHLFYGGFIEKLSIATSLVFLTCIRTSDTDTSSSPASSSSSGSVSNGTDFKSIMDYKPNSNGDDEDEEDEEDADDDDDDTKPEVVERKLTKKNRDRRVLAVSNIDIVIDLWQHFFKGLTAESTGRISSGFMDATDDAHAFDPPVFKRKLFMTLVRYMDQAWSHDKLHTLPPTTVKNVLELVQIVIKSLFEAKEYSLRTRVRSLSQSGRIRAHRNSFFVDDSDFMLSDEVGSAADGADIVDDPYEVLFGPSTNQSRPRSRRSYSLDAGIGRTSRSRESSGSLSSTVPGLTETSSSSTISELGPRSSSDSIEVTSPLGHLLPEIQKSPDEELITDKAVMFGLYKHTYTAVPQACLKLIERGIRVGGVQWRSEAAMLNKSFTREFTTVMVLTQMLRCLERPKWSDGTLKVIQLTSLYPRVVTLLEGGLNPQTCSSLYGLLHAILLLLSGKVMSSLRSSTKSNEMMFLVFGREGRFKIFYDLLISTLGEVANEVKKTPKKELPDNVCMDWISPALLILDAMTQPLLVDKVNIKTALGELEKINKIKQTFLTDSTDSTSARYIIPPELIASLQARFPDELGDELGAVSAAISGRSSTSSASAWGDGMQLMADFDEFMSGMDERRPSRSAERSSSTSAEDTVSAITETAAASEPSTGVAEQKTDAEVISESEKNTKATEESDTLPALFSLPLVVGNGLTTDMCLKTLDISLDILEMLSIGSSSRSFSIYSALMQLLVHITRIDEVRSRLLESGGIERFLHLATKFGGKSCFIPLMCLIY